MIRAAGSAAVVVALASSLVAAAPTVERIVLATDAAGDTFGPTAHVDRDERVDIVAVSYERTSTIATFTVEVADAADQQVEDVVVDGLSGFVHFVVDTCHYFARFDGDVTEECGIDRRTIGRARLDVGDAGSDTYRISVDLAQLANDTRGPIDMGSQASALWVEVGRRGMIVPAPIRVTPGRSGGQYDQVARDVWWRL